MKNLILVLSLLFSSILFSQTKVKGIVVDESGESVAFCNVIFKNSIKGTTTDENGKFYLESKKTYKELAVSFMGYKTTTISLKRVNYGLKIVLKEEGSNLKQVVIYSGKIKRKGNPAIALLKKMWDKKRKNGIHMFDYYEHDKYEKVEFDINNIDDDFKNQKLFKGMEFVFEKIDTSDVTGKTYLPFFINESKYKTFGKNTFPTQLRDELIANRNSGTKNNQNVNEFLKQLYADYNVYDNFIRLFDKAFTSPLSKVGPYTYNYVLTDSAFIGNKWCYNVTFYPRRKNELTFKGDFWVNDTTFAVKKIQMHASKSANINWIKEIYLEQEFTVLNDSVFLLKRDHMMSDFSLSKKDSKKGIYGRRTTVYDNYQFNIKKDNSFYTKRSKADYDIAVYTKDDNYWKKNRLEKLSDKEMGIYQLIDTLKTNKKFN
ncbi:MAG TPA: carboxypeptidase-like regulatory domain-containing protein, partial [Flavobacteriaceae bacterium]|nr:carboxypeptidase-like regulatory domain-containing protein [Flavobacteriaceae bacterium]